MKSMVKEFRLGELFCGPGGLAKRKLNSISEVLEAFADLSLNEEWDGQRN